MNIQKRSNRGFTLIEVLVSVVVLAIGLLGLMSLQLQALKTNSNSNFRTLATIAAYDMSERIRANKVGFESGNYDSIAAGSRSCSGCNAIAATDIAEWQLALSESLPEGKGAISSAGTDGLNIIVTWKQNDKNVSNVTKEFILRARFN